MAIIGIEGGIGTGKTMTLSYFAIQDIKKKRKIYTNIKFKDIKGNIQYLSKEIIGNMFELVKTNQLKMKNSSVIIQEMHNYMDSRLSMSKRGRTLTYWILQSRHIGEGACDIYFDTQDFSQVDIRLRRNIDYMVRPYITERINGIPALIKLYINAKIGHRFTKSVMDIPVYDVANKYDTHEVVDF